MALPARLMAGQRLLRPITQDDAAAVVAVLSQFEVSRWLTSVPHPYTHADFDAWLPGLPPGGIWAIEAAGRFVGVVGLNADGLGYWVDPAAQGRGHATAAAACVLAAHFAAADAGPVMARRFADNAVSAHLLGRLGFRETGRGVKFARSLGREMPQVWLRLTRADWAATAWAAKAWGCEGTGTNAATGAG